MKKIQIFKYSMGVIFLLILSIGFLTYQSFDLALELKYSLDVETSIFSILYSIVHPLFILMGSSMYFLLIPITCLMFGYFLNYKLLKKVALWVFFILVLINAFIALYGIPEDGLNSGVIGSVIISILTTLFGNSITAFILYTCFIFTVIKCYKHFNILLDTLFQYIVFPFFFKGQKFQLEKRPTNTTLKVNTVNSVLEEQVQFLNEKLLQVKKELEIDNLEDQFDSSKDKLNESEEDEIELAHEKLKTISLDLEEPNLEEDVNTLPYLGDDDKNLHHSNYSAKIPASELSREYSTIESSMGGDIGIDSIQPQMDEQKYDHIAYQLKNSDVLDHIDENFYTEPKEISHTQSRSNIMESLEEDESQEEPKISKLHSLKEKMKKMFEEQSAIVNRFHKIWLPMAAPVADNLSLSSASALCYDDIITQEEGQEYPQNAENQDDDYLINSKDILNYEDNLVEDIPYKGIPSFQMYQYHKHEMVEKEKEERKKDSSKPNLDLPIINTDNIFSFQDKIMETYFPTSMNGDGIQKEADAQKKVLNKEREEEKTSFYGVSIDKMSDTTFTFDSLSDFDEEFDTESPLNKDKESDSYSTISTYEKVLDDGSSRIEIIEETENIKRYQVIFEEYSNNEEENASNFKEIKEHLDNFNTIETSTTTINRGNDNSITLSNYQLAVDLERDNSLMLYYHLYDKKEIMTPINITENKDEISPKRIDEKSYSSIDFQINNHFTDLSKEEEKQLEELPESDFFDDFNPTTQNTFSSFESELQEIQSEGFSKESPAFKELEIEYALPGYHLLESNGDNKESISDLEIESNGKKIIQTLDEFNIQAILEDIIVGPVVTRYEISPPKGLKVNKIIDLSDNIALGLASKERVRIEAPVYGKSVVGVEVANSIRQVISFREMLEEIKKENIFQNEYHIPFVIGKALDGSSVIKDIVKMPHLLIAGSTGSGKSVCINALINSILFYKSPEDVKLLLVDPKRVELILYDGLPHLISPVIKETTEAIKVLKWLVSHMEERYYTLEEARVRNILEYNERQKENGLPKMPYLVVVMDEFADLILLGKREVEESVIRLAAMARAVGIHLVLATQRPSADVITGLIKANFASRVAFKVSSRMESRIILDENGAEDLLGKGDMLFMSSDMGGMTQRIQAPFISDKEVQDVTQFFKTRYQSNYWDEILEDDFDDKDIDTDQEDDILFGQAVDVIVKDQKASASYLQRRLKIGYNRAARLIEMMEERGIVGRASGSRPREILIDSWN